MIHKWLAVIDDARISNIYFVSNHVSCTVCKKERNVKTDWTDWGLISEWMFRWVLEMHCWHKLPTQALPYNNNDKQLIISKDSSYVARRRERRCTRCHTLLCQSRCSELLGFRQQMSGQQISGLALQIGDLPSHPSTAATAQSHPRPPLSLLDACVSACVCVYSSV